MAVWTARGVLSVIVMVVTGAINDLSRQYASQQVERGNPEDKKHKFEHPFFMAIMMFITQMICLLVFIIYYCYQQKYGDRRYARHWVNPLILAPPAICDMCATALLYVGLTLTYQSSFVMLRGTVIIFTALLSVAFLGHSVKYAMWGGMIVVVLGLAVVGLCGNIWVQSGESKDKNGIIAGDLLIVMSQILIAVQIVYEEKFIVKYQMSPLLTVGYEGLWGFIILGILLVPFSQKKLPVLSRLPTQKIEDPLDAFRQIGNSKKLLWSMIGLLGSISIFRYAGVSVTKEKNATTRIVLDSIRILVIWTFVNIFDWEKFYGLQILGYIMVMVGIFLFLEVIIVPCIKKIKERRQRRHQAADTAPLISAENPDIQAIPGPSTSRPRNEVM